MTNEDTIKYLNLHKYNGNYIHGKAMEKAIEAIKKQIPKKPKVKDKTSISYFYDCPCCEGYLVSVVDGELYAGAKYEYCYRCGQKLDWSEE